MRIEQVSQAYRNELVKKTEAADKKSKASSAPAGDKVNVSQSAKQLNETQSAVETTQAHVAGSPEIRVERVDEVKQKIKDGFYNTPEFADQLADKLIQDIGKDLGIST